MKKQFTLKGVLLAALVLFSSSLAMAQFTVNGSVKDGLGEPLIGVSILLKGSTIGTTTDFDGNFQLEVPGEGGALEFSYTGYKTQTVEISKDNASVDLAMEDDIANLDEVVVTGLASNIKRSNLANAVSTISSEEIVGVTTQQTVDGALYGKLTGVNIVQSNGAPGGGIALRLRGISSLSGNNQPLFIIDGVYLSNAEIPSGARFASGANSGTEEGSSNRIADINPDDIESIEVLKGASAAAIYGTRANAGVVIITTKKGARGETNISLEQDIGFNKIQNFVGRRDYTPQEVEDAFGASERALYEAAVANGTLLNYEEEIYGETGLILDTRLKISGGNDKTQFYIGGGARDEDGIIKGTGYERRSLRANINHKISDNLDISFNTAYVNSNSSRSFTGNENEGGLSFGYTLAFTRDWIDLRPDANGVYPDNPNYAGNPFFVRDQASNNEKTNRLIQGAKLNWKIWQQDNQVLRFTVNGGMDYFLHETNVYVPENHQGQVGKDNGFVGVGKNRFFNYNYQSFLSHDYYTPGNLSFSTQVGISFLNFKRDLVYAQTTQLIPLQNTLAQGGTQETDQAIQEEQEFGFIAQEQINWDDKIIGTVGIRFDKSDLNGDQNKYYAFPRASLAANIANFDFWTVEAIDQFKLRVAYGETGSSAAFGSLFTSLVPFNIGGRAGFAINPQQGNPNLEPETSQEIEFGADFSFLKGRLGLETTYYIRKVEDLLYDRSLPTSSGFTNEIRNDLDLENTGLELALRINPVRSEKFNWNTTFNFWFNNSEVTRLGISGPGTDANDIPSFVPPGVAFGLGLGTFFIDEGSPITALWGRDANNNPTIIGDVEPDFQLGWYNELNVIENLNISFLWHWKQGGDVLNLSRLLTNIGGNTPQEFDNLDGFIEDASYIRLREIGAYYTIPLNSDFIKSVKIGASGRNLLTFTDYSSYDPETSTKGGTGLSNGIEVTPFPSAKQAYFHLSLNF